MGKPKEADQIYKALGHPHRKRIIEILGKSGKSGFKELHEALNISVGALYHHVDALTGIIEQDPQRKYVLTEQGRLAYKLLKTEEGQLSSLLLTPWNRFLRALQRTLVLKRFFNYTSKKPVLSVAVAISIITFGAWIVAQANLEFKTVFPNSLSAASPLFIAASFVFTWLIIFSLSALMITVFLKRRRGIITLLIQSTISLLPFIIFSCIWVVIRILNVNITTVLASALLLPFEVWHIALMSYAIKHSVGARTYEAALVYFAVIYINLAWLVFIEGV